MQDDATSLIVILIGLVAVFVDGRLIWRSGTTYLQDVYPEPKVAASLNRLIAVLFHLVTLGALALISALVSGNTTESVLIRLGVILLVLAATHGITVWALARIRGRQREQRIQEEVAEKAPNR